MSGVFLCVSPKKADPEILKTSPSRKSNPAPSGFVSSRSLKPSTSFLVFTRSNRIFGPKIITIEHQTIITDILVYPYWLFSFFYYFDYFSCYFFDWFFSIYNCYFFWKFFYQPLITFFYDYICLMIVIYFRV